MMIFVLFVMAFVLGPALFLILVRIDGQWWPLMLISVLMVAFSFYLRKQANLTVGPAMMSQFLSVMLIWLAWILVLVLVVGAVRRAFPSPAMNKWSRVIGAMGTTVPWFGFVTAQMMMVE
jgi:hypothetical protein